mmetsp:Transcript_19746/g.54335  ORF Transcript_19746/g.54335 Transcript_19746/m.54335 type:complete len:82 (+) Transcript_19746:302-547(+)
MPSIVYGQSAMDARFCSPKIVLSCVTLTLSWTILERGSRCGLEDSSYFNLGCDPSLSPTRLSSSRMATPMTWYGAARMELA